MFNSLSKSSSSSFSSVSGPSIKASRFDFTVNISSAKAAERLKLKIIYIYKKIYRLRNPFEYKSPALLNNRSLQTELAGIP